MGFVMGDLRGGLRGREMMVVMLPEGKFIVMVFCPLLVKNHSSLPRPTKTGWKVAILGPKADTKIRFNDTDNFFKNSVKPAALA